VARRIRRLAVFDANSNKVGDVLGFQRRHSLGERDASDTAGTSYTFAVKVFPDELAGGTVWFTGANLLRYAICSAFPSVIEGTYFGPNAVAVGGVAPVTSRVSRIDAFYASVPGAGRDAGGGRHGGLP